MNKTHPKWKSKTEVSKFAIEEVQIAEFGVVEGVAVSGCNACVNIAEVFVRRTVAIGGHNVVLPVGRQHHLDTA